MTTIVLPISRTDYLKPVFDCLKKLERPDDTEILIITDGNEELSRKVKKRAEGLDYKKIRIEEFGDGPEEDRGKRRFRISEIHNKARKLISDKSTYVFSIEDDTTYPPNTLKRFVSVLENQGYQPAFVQGVELGRWNTPYVGGWKADNDEEPKIIASVMPNARGGLEYISAGGLYCALVDAELYRLHNFEPFDKVGKNGLGCDINFGLWITNQGYRVMIDWSIECDHIGDRGAVNMGNATPKQVIFEKDSIDNKWFGRSA